MTHVSAILQKCILKLQIPTSAKNLCRMVMGQRGEKRLVKGYDGDAAAVTRDNEE
jgi:hypothetical protein